MSQPAVIITEIDGSLGVLPPTAGKLLACVGVSSKGTINVPATYARVKDVIAAYGDGPLVEAACHYIDRYGRPVILVRTASTVAAAVSTVTTSNAGGTGIATGTAVVTINNTPPAAPADDYELGLYVVNGGTVATAGITYQLSFDGGRNKSAVTPLGVATQIDTGVGVIWKIAAGTMIAGESYAARATAAQWNGTEIMAALDALAASVATWEIVQIVGAIDGVTFDNIEGKIAGMLNAGKPRAWVGNTRIPNAGESEAAYLTALSALFATKSSKVGELCAGACKLASSVNGRKYRRPVSMAIAARQQSVSEEINIAAVDTGALPGVAITDANGNVDEHNESVNPGLDDARFTVLRTVDGYQGIYVNRPRLFAPDGSDFQLMPHRRVINIVHIALRVYFTHRLNKPVLVDKSTGFILESEALEIEAGARAVMRAEVLVKPKASAVQFALSRTDNVLSTKTLTGQARVVPLAYPEYINIDLGYVNPALQVVSV
jgi:hypothetical protein